MASRCGPIFGASQMIVRSTLPIREPGLARPARPRARRSGSRARRATAGRSAGSAGRYRPRRPRRASRRPPRGARRRRRCARRGRGRARCCTPHSHSSSPSARRWTSKPVPMRGKGRASMKSSANVSLRSRSSPSTSATASPAARATCASSPAVGVAGPGAVRGENGGDSGTPAGSARGAAPRGRRCRPSGRLRPRARLSTTGSTGIAPGHASERARAAGRSTPAGQSGRAASWISTNPGASAASASSAARTEACRVAPPVTRRTPGKPGERLAGDRFGACRDGHHHRPGAGRDQRLGRVAHQRLAAPARELLGHRLPGAQALPGGDDDRGKPGWSGGAHGERGR